MNERLEEIKENKTYLNSLQSRICAVDEADFDWLISTVEEQQKEIEESKKFKSEVEKHYKYTHLSAKKSIEEKEKLKKENARLRETLNKISDYDWETHDEVVSMARKALEGEQ